MTGGDDKKDDPRNDGDGRDTEPVDPVDAGWDDLGLDDLGLDDLLGPDEGPTVVDGSLEMAAAEMAAAEMAKEESREPSRTYLGMGPSSQVPDADADGPDDEMAEVGVSGEEATEVGLPGLPEQDAPGTLDSLASQAEPLPASDKARSPLADLSSDVAFKDTLLPSASEPPALAPEPMAPEEKPPAEAKQTQERVSGKAAPPRPRAMAETEPSQPVVRPPTGVGKADEVALAATMAPGDMDVMAMAPTMALDPDSAVLRVAPPAPEPKPPEREPMVPEPEPVVASPEPPPQPQPTPKPAAPQPKPAREVPTEVVPSAARPQARASKAPSNLTLTVLWVLALLSVLVAVALYLFRP